MNTKLHASLLLPFAAAMLNAQDLDMRLSRPLGTIAAQVDGAKANALVVMVLGTSQASIALPGDMVLGVQPDLVTGFQIADRAGSASLRVKRPNPAFDFEIYAQAVAVCADLPLEARGGITTSTVQIVPPEGSLEE